MPRGQISLQDFGAKTLQQRIFARARTDFLHHASGNQGTYREENANYCPKVRKIKLELLVLGKKKFNDYKKHH